MIAFALIAAGPPARAALDLIGAGSTFAYPVLSRWADGFFKETGHKVNYQSVGSGGGIKQIEKRLVDFGATDMALESEELKSKDLYQFPLIAGEIVAIVQIAALGERQIKLDGAVLADIFLGRIQNWNEERLQKLNPGLTLPDLGITVVHRADGSGTTYNWTRYLTDSSPKWRSEVGAATAVRWPTGVGGKGNEGVAAFVKRIEGSIGYVELAFVKAAHLRMAHLPQPVLATTFVLLPRALDTGERGRVLLTFFRWIFERGPGAATALEYRPLPAPEATGVMQGWRRQWPAITAGL